MHRFMLSIALLPLLASASVFAQNKNATVVMETSMGTIHIELNPKKAPITVKNFLKYVDGKHYDGTIYHRVIRNFMIQGGGFSTKGEEKVTGKGIRNESKNGLSNARGTIAMARTGQPHSATAQFFINVKDNDFLDGNQAKWGYAVFGKVVKGMDVVDKIRNVRTGKSRMKARLPNGQLFATTFDDVPTTQVVIRSIHRLKKQ